VARSERSASAASPDPVVALLELERRVAALEAALAGSALPVTGALGRLSAAEHAIAQRVLAGRTNEQIAHDLHYSPKTVEWTLTKVYRKLNVRSRTELAVRLAREPVRTGLAAAV
jgi:DNA-binding CsgD family transcriptional regulator